MEFDKAKTAIKKMADEIDNGTFTQEALTDFVLAFRFDLFQAPVKPEPSRILYPYHTHGIISCSCASEENSCLECGPGFTTGFYTEEKSGDLVKFKIKK